MVARLWQSAAGLFRSSIGFDAVQLLKRMIAKYPGLCMYCRKPIEVGVDTYDIEIKKSYHEACRENQPPRPEDYKLADELDFVPHDDASIRAAAARWQVRDHWLLRHLLDANRSRSTRWPEPATPRRPDAPLFDEAKGVK
jgi:hypothetical protein